MVVRFPVWDTGVVNVPLDPTSRLARSLGACLLLFAFPSVAPAGPPEGRAPGLARPQDDERLSAEERELIDVDRRRGRLRQVLEDLDELREELPDDWLLASLRARARFDACQYDGALEDADAAFEALRVRDGVAPEDVAEAARTYAELLVRLGRAAQAVAKLDLAGGAIRPDLDARDAWVRGRALAEIGAREQATAVFRVGAEAAGVRTWDALLAQARCQRQLGRIRAAATTLVAADKVATDGMGTEPDVLAALGDVYFEAYGEVEGSLSESHSPAELYNEALRLHPDHEGARLGLFELYRFNWRRRRLAPDELLNEVFAARPLSIPGLLARASSALDDGDLLTARGALDSLVQLAPGRRDVRTQQAALLWIDNDEGGATAVLERLREEDPGDSAPDREVGRHLLELYRFAEGLPFLARAVKSDSGDWMAWTWLGRAQANTGDEDAARHSLERASEVAEGRKNAWRDNTALVLKRMDDSMVEKRAKELSFLWLPDAAPLLERYLIPFYRDAREELAERYGFTPGPVKIEVFRKWEDFSVRSTGFEGYPALGVCFGPVVTAVSPLSVLRGTFSWARTSYHEFTHVIHLGLSHNRCPRWVTEGLATWEEGEKNAAWWRNLRREMLDALANDAVFPVRRLNGAFRGPHVIFAYYQSGLLCKMLIEEHGFPPIVRLLEAFDRGADLDTALDDVYGKTPEELDVAFRAFAQRELGDLAIEPRWSPDNTFRRRFRLTRTPPEDAIERAAWTDEWSRVAWGAYWARDLVDAGEALRLAATGGELPPRGLFLRGELRLTAGDRAGARKAFEAGFAAGGEDYRARMAYAAILIQDGESKDAEEHFLAAERAFPGYEEERFSAELRLADLYEAQGREDEANAARLRWLGYNAGNYTERIAVGEWAAAKGDFETAARLFQEANDVDPFRRHLHFAWGVALYSLERYEEALREFDVGWILPQELDGDVLIARGLGADPSAEPGDQLIDLASLGTPERPTGEFLLQRWASERPLLLGYTALTLVELERFDEAEVYIADALAMDPDCEPALRAKERLP